MAHRDITNIASLRVTGLGARIVMWPKGPGSTACRTSTFRLLATIAVCGRRHVGHRELSEGSIPEIARCDMPSPPSGLTVELLDDAVLFEFGIADELAEQGVTSL